MTVFKVNFDYALVHLKYIGALESSQEFLENHSRGS